jgi:hypothetical protein
MKMQLINMDARGTGRVPLSKFYGTSLDSEWRFSESEAYLRELGALDETSTWHRKEVIISNYIQGTSNCIVSTSHFRVCCLNMCEHVLTEIETALQSSTASPSDILRVVSTVTAPTSIDDEGAPNLPKTLITHLEQIAEASDGTVPLHGRLFQQWLHYVFPQECPFPHKAGTVSKVSAMEYAGVVEVPRHVREEMSTNSTSQVSEHEESSDWMSQWNEEEELLAGYSSETRTLSSFRNFFIVLGGALLLLAGRGIRKKPDASGVSFAPKSHWV